MADRVQLAGSSHETEQKTIDSDAIEISEDRSKGNISSNSTRFRKPPSQLTLSMLHSMSDVPLYRAAERLGMSTSYLKNACRRLGLSRWPRAGRSIGTVSAVSQPKVSIDYSRRLLRKYKDAAPEGSQTTFSTQSRPAMDANVTVKPATQLSTSPQDIGTFEAPWPLGCEANLADPTPNSAAGASCQAFEPTSAWQSSAADGISLWAERWSTDLDAVSPRGDGDDAAAGSDWANWPDTPTDSDACTADGGNGGGGGEGGGSDGGGNLRRFGDCEQPGALTAGVGGGDVWHSSGGDW
jgi:hypothetical protein